MMPEMPTMNTIVPVWVATLREIEEMRFSANFALYRSQVADWIKINFGKRPDDPTVTPPPKCEGKKIYADDGSFTVQEVPPPVLPEPPAPIHSQMSTALGAPAQATNTDLLMAALNLLGQAGTKLAQLDAKLDQLLKRP